MTFLSRGTVRLLSSALACAALWLFVALRYSGQSAIPLNPSALLLRIGLWTLAHYTIGRALAGRLQGHNSAVPAWGFYLLTGHAAVPCVLWVADRVGHRSVGWLLLALLALVGLAQLLSSARALLRSVARPRADAYSATAPLILALALAQAALLYQDDIIYLKTGRERSAVSSYSYEDNLAHAAFAQEFGRQEPYQYFWKGFVPEDRGLPYHFLTDIQIWAWSSVPSGDVLDVVHRERFVLQGFALLTGVYLLAYSLTTSSAAGLLVAGLAAAFPFSSLGLGNPNTDSLQQLWRSYTAQNGAALAAGFLASLWIWCFREERRFISPIASS